MLKAVVSGEEILIESNLSVGEVKRLMVLLLKELSLKDKRDAVDQLLIALEKSELFFINSGF